MIFFKVALKGEPAFFSGACVIMVLSFLRRMRSRDGRASQNTKVPGNINSARGGLFRKRRAKPSSNKSSRANTTNARPRPLKPEEKEYYKSNVERVYTKKVANMHNAAKRLEIQRLRLIDAAKTKPELLRKTDRAYQNMARAYELHRLGEKQLKQIRNSPLRKMKMVNIPYGPIVKKGEYHPNFWPEMEKMVRRSAGRNRHLPTPTNWTNLHAPHHIGPVQGLRQLIQKVRAGEPLHKWEAALLSQAAGKAHNRAKRHAHLMDWERNIINLTEMLPTNAYKTIM